MMSTGHLVVELTAELLAVGQRRRTQRRRVPAGLRDATRAQQLDTARDRDRENAAAHQGGSNKVLFVWRTEKPWLLWALHILYG